MRATTVLVILAGIAVQVTAVPPSSYNAYNSLKAKWASSPGLELLSDHMLGRANYGRDVITSAPGQCDCGGCAEGYECVCDWDDTDATIPPGQEECEEGEEGCVCIDEPEDDEPMDEVCTCECEDEEDECVCEEDDGATLAGTMSNAGACICDCEADEECVCDDDTEAVDKTAESSDPLANSASNAAAVTTEVVTATIFTTVEVTVTRTEAAQPTAAFVAQPGAGALQSVVVAGSAPDAVPEAVIGVAVDAAAPTAIASVPSATINNTPTEPTLPSNEEIIIVEEVPSADDINGNSDLSKWILQYHNDLRTQFGASPVKWSSDLAANASSTVSSCVLTPNQSANNIVMYAVAEQQWTVDSVLREWANEWSKYDYNSPGPISGTGEFTAMVWKDVSVVGCGWHYGCTSDLPEYPFSLYFTCRYSPSPNDAAVFADMVGKLQG